MSVLFSPAASSPGVEPKVHLAFKNSGNRSRISLNCFQGSSLNGGLKGIPMVWKTKDLEITMKFYPKWPKIMRVEPATDCASALPALLFISRVSDMHH